MTSSPTRIKLPSTPLPSFTLVHPSQWPPSLSPSAENQKYRINVLDSSFNPPHLAHYSLASMNRSNEPPFDARLLVLGSSNADKGSTDNHDLIRRLEMMKCMALDMDHGNDVGKVGVVVCEGARFVDKSRVIQEWLKTKSEGKKVELAFAMGWDTLIRFFNPKYYGDSYTSCLTSFFSADNSSILCARRGDVSSIQEEEFLSSKDVMGWRDKIEMCDVDERAFNVSSTEIRKAVKDQRWDDVEKWVPVEGVRDVIRNEGLYEE